MTHFDHRIAELAARQHAAFSRRQALRLGGTNDMFMSRVASGRWRRARRGVFAIAGAPETWEQTIAIDWLAVHGPAWVSHSSALALLGVEPVGRHKQPTHILVPRGSRSRVAGLRVHETVDLLPADLWRVDGIKTTSPTRSLIDAAAVLHAAILEEAVDDALRQGLMGIRRLAWRYSMLCGPGRYGATTLGRIIDARLRSTPPKSVLETRFRCLCERANIEVPVGQYEVVLPNGRRAFLDFADPHLRLYYELDGSHHAQLARLRRDMQRQNALSILGWRPLRFVWEDVVRRPAQTLAAVVAARSQALCGDLMAPGRHISA
jgi:hypothetical protein